MKICTQCGVELDEGMTVCPLCRTPADAGHEQKIVTTTSESSQKRELLTSPSEKHLLQRIIWQVTSIILLSAITATVIIDYAVHKEITWSIYPLSICLILLSYASIVALWHTGIVLRLLTGFLTATVFLIVLNLILSENDWTTQLALPILFVINLLTIAMIVGIKSAKTKGLNIFALIVVAIALLCISVEGIISIYTMNNISLRWSIIVAACLLPVTAALFFMYFRTKNNADLQKIFHT